MRSLVKRRVTLILAVAVILAMTLTAFPIHVSLDTSSPSVIRIGFGNPASAHDEDYTCDGVEDNVQWQAALTALPASGGQLEVEAGTYYWADGDHRVTRSLDNVSIVGVGGIAFFDGDGTHPIFEAGGNRWFFSNIRTDTGGIEMGSTTNWMWLNVYDGTTYYPLLTDNIDIEDHSARHQAGGDDSIRLDDLASPEANTDLDATGSIHGLMPAADKSKLDAIEAGADVTDDVNVEAAGAVMEEDFDAYTVLVATTDDTPFALSVAQQTLVGRLTGGVIDDIAIGKSDNDIVQVDGSPAETNYARWTTSGLTGRTFTQVKEDLDLEIGEDIISKATYDAHVGAADPHTVYVLETLFDADTFLYASVDNTPVATSPSNVLAALSGHAGSAFDLNTQDLENGGVIFLNEQASAEADVAGQGQIWVQTGDPNTLWFTDEGGTDTQLGIAGADEKVKIDSGATAGYLGAASNDGVLRSSAPLQYSDGGDFVTLALDASGADKILYSDGVDSWAETSITSDARGLLDDADYAAMRSTLTVYSTAQVDSAIDTDIATHAGLADPHTGYVLESLFDADTFLYASTDNTPVATSPASVLGALSGHATSGFDWGGQDLENGGVIFLTEQAAAETDVPGKGQIWVQTGSPNTLWFTDEGGADTQLGVGGADEKVKVDSGATADYLGAASNDGVLRTSAPFQYTDGGDFITLALDASAADKMLYSNGIDSWAETTVTANARGLLDDADYAAMRSTLGVYSTAQTDSAIDTDIATHAGLADPHTGYLLESLADAKGDILVATAGDTWTILTVGSENEVLTVGASNQLTWTTPPGGGDVSKSGTPSADQVAVWASGSTIEGDPNFTFDEATETLSIGVADTDDGILVLNADTDTGGKIQLHVEGDSDDPIVSFDMAPNDDDLWIGPSTDTDMLVFNDSTSITAKKLLNLYDSADLVVYSDSGVSEVARIDGATGAITTSSTVDGVDIAALNSAAVKNTDFTQSGGVLAGTGAGTYSEVLTIAGFDSTAIHDNVAAEISAITLKNPPASGDYLLIEDSEAGNVKKYITVGSLPASTHALGAGQTDVEIDGTPADNEVLAYDSGGNWINQTPSEAGLQTWDDDLDDLAGLTPTDSYFIVGDNTDWVAEQPSTARTSLGVYSTTETDSAIDTDISTHEGAADPHTGYVLETLFDADTFLYASTDNTPVATSPANVLAALTGHAGADFDWGGYDLRNAGVLFLTEQASADADVADKGQIWVQTGAPNTLWFTDENGTDTQLGVGGADEKVKVDSGATADYIGAASNDGVLRTSAPFQYTDGGNFITLALDASAADKMLYSNGIDTWTETTITANARNLLDDSTYADMRTTLTVYSTTETDSAIDTDISTHAGAADPHTGYLLESLYDAHTLIIAISDNTPQALTVYEQTLVGRLTGGNIDDISIGLADNNILQVDDATSIQADDWLRATSGGGVVGMTNAATINTLGGAATQEFDWNTVDLDSIGVMWLNEQAAAETDQTDKGQIWVKTGSPNTLWFTDEGGSDYQLGVASSDEKVKVDSGATADYIGAASNDGVLRTSAPFQYSDGGDFITLALDASAADKMLYSDGVDTWAELTTTSFGRALLADADGGDVLSALSGAAEAEFDWNGQDLDDIGVMWLKEQADAEADAADYGQIWVNTATPNELYFTTDTGIDKRLDSEVTITFVIDGGGSAITTGVWGFLEIPFNCYITGWTLVADQSGSIVIDVWSDVYANFPPTVVDTIAGSEKPTLSSADDNQDLTLTTWTEEIAAGDVMGFNVDSASTVERVTLSIRAYKT